MNLHNPERGADESAGAYRARRAASNRFAKRRLTALHPVDRSGQHRNPIRAERRALVAAIGRRQAVKQIKRERRAAIASVQASV